MATGIVELAIVILVAAVLGAVARLLKQPVLLAYLTTGILIGALGFKNLIGGEALHVFSNLGIMFLLFLVGLEINYRSLRIVGKTSLIVGLGQIIFTAALGYFITQALGFATLPGLYIAIALTFSSTIIIVKLLSDKKDLGSLYGKISVGFLLVQDLVAILLLIFLSGFSTNGVGGSFTTVALTMGKGLVLLIAVWLVGKRFLHRVMDRLARSEELVFLVSLAWLFVVAAAASQFGFSIEIAGFLAGVALAGSSQHFQISSRVSPLRDFFILIFFVLLGASVSLSDAAGLALPTVILSLFVLIGNPLIVLCLMGLLGYRKRTSFFAGVTVAQISEFSLILAALGIRVGHLSESEVTLVTSVGLITIALSTYLITYAHQIFRVLAKPLSLFERRRTHENDQPETGFKKPIVLIGCHRTGESILANLPRDQVLVVDFDPEVIHALSERGIATLYGDARDRTIIEAAEIEQAKLVISTSPDVEDNLALLEEIKRLPARPSVAVRAESEADAVILYRAGADYVLLPHFAAGHSFGMLAKAGVDHATLATMRERDLAALAAKHGKY
jgi:Kef-type K+ transport system membrane component KefB